MLVVRCVLFIVRAFCVACLLFVGRCAMCVDVWLFDVGRVCGIVALLLLVHRSCMLIAVVCWWWFVVCRLMLFVVHLSMVFVVCCLLLVVRCV